MFYFVWNVRGSEEAAFPRESTTNQSLFEDADEFGGPSILYHEKVDPLPSISKFWRISASVLLKKYTATPASVNCVTLL